MMNYIKLWLFIVLFSLNALATENSVKHAAIVVDAEKGVILHNENGDKPRYPASLTKMMTIYLTFEAIQQGKLSFDDTIIVSHYAASRPRINMNLRKGDRMTVNEAVHATIIRSANDVAAALAEEIAGSEEKFAAKMNERARQLGMHSTHFRNASGLPDPNQKTTAIDMAKLAIALKRDFPQFYHLFSRTSFNFRNHTYHGHNRVTAHYPGATGLKTGITNASGYNIVTSAQNNGKKLIGVVMGGPSAHARDKRVMSLLDKYFYGKEMYHQKAMHNNQLAKKKTLQKKTLVAANSKKKVVAQRTSKKRVKIASSKTKKKR